MSPENTNMNNKNILIKLAKIASNQHKILTKLVLAINSSDEELLEDLSGPDTEREPWLENQMISIEHGNNLLNKGVESDFPPGFEQKLLLHKTRSGERPQDYEPVEDPYAEYDELTGGHVVRQLKLLSAGDPYMWNLIGKAYKGWTPEHVAKLLKKINEHNRYE